MIRKAESELSKAGMQSRKFRAANPEYSRIWRKTHPENVKQANIRYWKKKLAELTTDENN